jgi:hypothetical protein
MSRVTSSSSISGPLTIAGAIPIEDSAGNPLTSTGGALNVNISGGSNYTSISTYNEITNLAMGIETTIVSYTVPSGSSYYLQFIEASGQNLAEYHIYKNSSIIAKKYSSYTEFNVNFDYKTGISSTPGIFLTTGDVVYVKVLNVNNSTADFNARIQIMEIG